MMRLKIEVYFERIKKMVMVLLCSIFLFSCKISYLVIEEDSLKNKEFENSIDGTQDYFKIFIFIDKSLSGNRLFIEQGTSTFHNVVYDNVFKTDDNYKLFKVENTKNIKIHVNNEYFHPINIGFYKKYRFLYIKKYKNRIEFKYSNTRLN